MRKNIFFTGLFISLFSVSSIAQVAMGKWRTHFAYNNVSQIAQSDNKIFAVSEGALYSVDKQDGGMEFYSKNSGLNGSTISRIEYDAADKALLIIYSTGNIDIMTSGGIINLPDLYNKQMSAAKDINHILYYQDKAYLSCNFGVLVLNMKKKEVADTYYIGPNASEVKVLNTAVHNGIIYALTASTVFQASVTESHLVNYEFWTSTNGLPGSGDFQKVCSFDGQLLLQRGGKTYKMGSNNQWASFLPDVNVSYMNVSNQTLNIFDGTSAYITDLTFNTKTINSIGAISDAEYDATNNTYYFAANALGIIAYKQIGSETPAINYFKPAGPAVNIPWDMTFSGKKLFVVPGGRWAGQYNRDGNVMMYEDGVWTNIFSKPIQDSTKHAVTDFCNVAVDPGDNKHFFVTSYGTGLYEFKNNAFSKWYTPNTDKCNLESVIPSAPLDYTRIDGAVYDKDGNLLLSNSNVSGGVKILQSNGIWAKITNTAVNKPNTGKILISNQNPNQKWVLSYRYTPGLAIYDDNGTYNTESDDKSTFISGFTYPEIDNNGLTKLISIFPYSIFSIAQDKNGVIWVGTDMGPFLFNNLNNVFNSGYTCSRVKIPRNDSTNLADYLLVNENIKAIAIDGANRKWIGTGSSGVYLMSENGQQTIQHFTMTNSPLLSNEIMSIAINPVSGEVFFGTSQGIVSYQSDASEAGGTFENVYAYPNPVRQGYTGVITITGLVENTQVKITDINGNLVCETVSNGSIATWDGKDLHGRKVSTGIYLAICVNADGSQNTITKIMVIN